MFILWSFSAELPSYSELKHYNPSLTTRVFTSDGLLLDKYFKEERIFVPIERIPNSIIHAFISAEDKKFYKHFGIDPLAIIRAAFTNLYNKSRNKKLIGASTITQQVVKNLLLSNEVTIERKIKDICEINNPFSGEEYIEMIKRNLDEYPFLMEQNVVSYLKRYLSYGREDIQPLEYRVYFQVKRNMFSEISDMDELVQLEMETWGKMWKEDEFLDAVNNFIGVERMKEIIERWGSTPQIHLGEVEAAEVYQKMIKGQRTFIEGSLTWWTRMLNCPYVVPFIPDIQDGIDNRILQFLFQMEDSFLEIFDGTQFQMRENTWFVYGEGEMNTPNFMNRDTYRNWYIDTYGKQPKIKEVLRWLKHMDTRAYEANKLINMKNTFVRLGSSRFQRSRLMPDVARISEVEMYRYFEEFIDLLNFATIGRISRRDDERLVDIEREFRNAQYERYKQDLR